MRDENEKLILLMRLADGIVVVDPKEYEAVYAAATPEEQFDLRQALRKTDLRFSEASTHASSAPKGK